MPYPLFISQTSPNSFTITATDLIPGEYTEMILEMKTDLTVTSWVSLQTNYGIISGESVFTVYR